MIKLIDLIKLSGIELHKYKIHCATGKTNPPLESFFDGKFRASYLKGENHIDNLLIAEIRDQRMSVGDFPGYNSILISYKILCTIIRDDLPTWKSA